MGSRCSQKIGLELKLVVWRLVLALPKLNMSIVVYVFRYLDIYIFIYLEIRMHQTIMHHQILIHLLIKSVFCLPPAYKRRFLPIPQNLMTTKFNDRQYFWPNLTGSCGRLVSLLITSYVLKLQSIHNHFFLYRDILQEMSPLLMCVPHWSTRYHMDRPAP